MPVASQVTVGLVAPDPAGSTPERRPTPSQTRALPASPGASAMTMSGPAMIPKRAAPRARNVQPAASSRNNGSRPRARSPRATSAVPARTTRKAAKPGSAKCGDCHSAIAPRNGLPTCELMGRVRMSSPFGPTAKAAMATTLLMTSGMMGRRGQVPQRTPTGIATTSAARQVRNASAPLPWTLTQTTGMSGTRMSARTEPRRSHRLHARTVARTNTTSHACARGLQTDSPRTMPSATSSDRGKGGIVGATSRSSHQVRPIASAETGSATRLVPIRPADR